MCPATELIQGVVLPERPGYGWIYYNPSQREAAEKEAGNDRSIVDLDVAFELITERISSLVIYTQGYFVHVSLGGLPVDVDGFKFGYFLRRAV